MKVILLATAHLVSGSHFLYTDWSPDYSSRRAAYLASVVEPDDRTQIQTEFASLEHANRPNQDKLYELKAIKSALNEARNWLDQRSQLSTLIESLPGNSLLTGEPHNLIKAQTDIVRIARTFLYIVKNLDDFKAKGDRIRQNFAVAQREFPKISRKLDSIFNRVAKSFQSEDDVSGAIANIHNHIYSLLQAIKVMDAPASERQILKTDLEVIQAELVAAGMPDLVQRKRSLIN